MSGRTSSSGWPLTAATTALAGGVREAGSPSGSRPTPSPSAMPSIRLAKVSTSGPQMSSERPAAPGTAGVRARYSITSRSSIGWVRFERQRGIGSRRRRSTSRTSTRNEDDPAPITMDARSAVEAGSAVSRISSTSSRERRCGEAAPAGAMPPR